MDEIDKLIEKLKYLHWSPTEGDIIKTVNNIVEILKKLKNAGYKSET